MNLSASETRVLGCMLEKQLTTPDIYPLTLNSLRLACNQSTNRDPVVEYDDAILRDALHHLERRGFTRLASGRGRAPKYRHLLAEALPMAGDEQAGMSVLMLRGPQTPGELKQRSERLVESELSLADVERVLAELTERGYATDLGRRPGQKEDRWAQLLGGEAAQPVEVFSGVGLTASRDFVQSSSVERDEVPDEYRSAPPPAATAQQVSALDTRVAALEADLASLREQLADLLS